LRKPFHDFDFEARDSDKLREPLGAGTTLAASFDAELQPASGSAGLSCPGGLAAQPPVPGEGPRVSGERPGDGVEALQLEKRWKPSNRVIDERDFERRSRRTRRHGRERQTSEPMRAAIRLPGDAKALGYAELSADWARWIDRATEWVWFTTHTFLYDVSPEVALALYDRWLARLAEACRQKSRCPPELQAACAIEWTHARRVHLHSVIAGRGLGRLRMLRWQHRWEDLDRLCGMARVFSAKDRASAYLAKYCGKGGVVVVRGRFAGWHASHERDVHGRTSRKPR
jgi:hypothetical protein